LGRNPDKCRGMNSGQCPKKDDPKIVAAEHIRAAKFKALQAA
jgi:hypothetical protein